MKQISLDGRLGKDAEITTTSGGTRYVKFSLCNSSYDHGKEQSEWFDVISYSPYIIDKISKNLTKGRYVLVTGAFKAEVAIKGGKVFLNQYVTANNIEFLRTGVKKEAGEEPSVSTYTSTKPVQEPTIEPTVGVMPPQSAVPTSVASNNSDVESYTDDDDDLPF